MVGVQRIVIALLLLVGVVLVGSFGYSLIEGWSVFDSLYMTIITLATVGFREVHDLSVAGKLFTIVLIVSGAGLIAYAMGSIITFVLEGQLGHLLGRKKVAKMVREQRNHYIVCGYGRIGQQVVRILAAKPLPLVVVEKDPDLCARLRDAGHLFVQGDATHDETLLEAGLQQARGLITITSSDTDNLFITLSARGLNPELFILARASEPSAEVKLRRAGASQVISPYTIGAQRIAQAILRPSVVDFLELAATQENLELQIEEVPIAPQSSLVGKALRHSGLRDQLNIIIVSIRKKDGSNVFNPAPDTVIDADDLLITVGEQGATHRLLAIAAGQDNA